MGKKADRKQAKKDAKKAKARAARAVPMIAARQGAKAAAAARWPFPAGEAKASKKASKKTPRETPKAEPAPAGHATALLAAARLRALPPTPGSQWPFAAKGAQAADAQGPREAEPRADMALAA